ncbi:hypothetical protein DCO56_06810 [Sphingobacterium athyrii]|uniref:Uncharacterized protein n=1 Tax=Sphingobacterium athyrii TaxID=2152717 RepID=A0A363NV62_9SPHI|nr:hypothetical protein DCO56_06810 [Sphingobacterium athyrii]
MFYFLLFCFDIYIFSVLNSSLPPVFFVKILKIIKVTLLLWPYICPLPFFEKNDIMFNHYNRLMFWFGKMIL